MRQIVILLAGATTLAFSASAVWALEVDPDVTPEISLGGRLVATGRSSAYDRPSGNGDGQSEVDFGDSGLLLGVRKYLYKNEMYGFGNFGLRVKDDDSDFEDSVFIHQAHVGLGDSRSELLIGRTNLLNTLVAFPTIRDSDLLEFTHVLNAGSNAHGEEFQVYGGNVRGSYYFVGSPWQITGALTARAETDLGQLADRSRTSTNKFNGLAAGIAYDKPEAVKFDQGFRYAGLMLDVQRPERIGGTGSETVPAVIAGLTYNLNSDPERAWVLDAQGIYTFGNQVPGLGQPVYRAQAESWSAVAALRYVSRPALQTRWQAGLTLAYKDYSDFSDARAYAAVPSFSYRLGSGIEAVAQYRYQANDGRLAIDQNIDSSHAVYIGLTFALSGTFNESVGERASILDMEHKMTNPGPVSRGH